MSLPRRRTRRYWVRLITIGLIAVVLTTICTPVVLGFVTTYRLVRPSCFDNGHTPGDYGYSAEDITLAARAGGSFRAYFIPGTNTATIIIPPPYHGGRGSRLHEADVLARHGYAVFTFESRSCAGISPVSLGYGEIDEVMDALAYLQTRDDLDPDRIGILGFSSAGATAIMSAAHLPDLRAVAAEGGYGDFVHDAVGLDRENGAPLITIYKHAITFSYHLLTGISADKLNPAGVINQIGPRPVLLIYGSRESSLEGARRQLAAAGDNATLWIVDGAGHGNYLEVAPQAYEQRLISFFDNALLGEKQ
jgi:dienelactone hydrolase